MYREIFRKMSVCIFRMSLYMYSYIWCCTNSGVQVGHVNRLSQAAFAFFRNRFGGAGVS